MHHALRSPIRTALSHVRAPALAAVLVSWASPAAASSDPRGPLTGAHAIRLEIRDDTAGALAVLLPLPDRRHGHTFAWSTAEVHTVRAGGDGYCRVQVRRGADDPAHELDIELSCGRHRGDEEATDLRLDTTYRFTTRKKAVVAEFSRPEGASATVTAAIR